MTNLRRYLLGNALYLAIIFVLGQADYLGRPFINFAAYFYLIVMIGVPATLLFPFVTRVAGLVPLAFWAGVYIAMSFVIDRSSTADSNDISVFLLEFILLEVGIWFAHQLALQINHAESVVNELAINIFPHRAEQLDAGSPRVKIEFSRSRRHHRPLSLLLMEVDPEFQRNNREVLKSIQYDIANRLTTARVGQIIDGCIRQTDLVLRDRTWCYVILCPETDLSAVLLLANRITGMVKQKTGLDVLWGVATFPEEALIFDDLLRKARARLRQGEVVESIQQKQNVGKEIPSP